MNLKKKFGRKLAAITAATIAMMGLTVGANAADSRDVPTPRSGASFAGPYTSPPGNYNVASGPGYEWFHSISGMSSHWLGALNVNGNKEYCINLDSPAPSSSEAATLVTNPKPNPVPGVLGDLTVTNAQMGWIFKNFQARANKPDTDGAITAAAISVLAHANYEVGSGRNYVQRLILDVMDAPSPTDAIRIRAKEMVKDAKNSGVAAAVPKATTEKGGMEFTVGNIGVQETKYGNVSWIPGVKATATIIGPGVWSNGSKTIDFTTGTSETVLKGKSTGNGQAKVNVTYEKVGYGVLMRDRAITQSTIELRTGDPKNKTSNDFDLIFDFQPVVSSQVAAKFVEAGNAYEDTITMKADPNYVNPNWTEVDGKPVPAVATTYLYYAGITPPAQSGTVPSSAVLVGQADSTFNGPGDQKISIPTDGTGGYYVTKTEFKVANQPADLQDYFHGDATYDYGLENETTIMQVTPKITTEASDKLVLPGDNTSDNVTVSLLDGEKWPVGAQLKATGKLYGPFDMTLPQSATVPSDAPVAATQNLVFTENNQTLQANWTAGDVGFYTWVWTIDKSAQDNPDLWAKGFTDDFMINVETSSNRIPKLTHYSLSREYNVHADGLAFDTIEIGGYMPSHTEYKGNGYFIPDNLKAQVKVYDAGKNPDWSQTEPPAGTPVHWETEVQAVNGKFEIGYDDSHPITGFKPGHYYVFRYEFTGDDRVAPFASNFNDIRERFFVPDGTNPPQAITQATDSAYAGDEIEDEALVTGEVPLGSYLVFNAYGPQDENETPSCEGEPFFTSEKINVLGAGYYKSGTTTVDTAGLVYWVETLYDADGEILSQGKCGIPSETTTIEEPVELGTEASGLEGTNMIPAAPDQTIVDTVCYKNVTPGKEYEVQGILMDKETGAPLLTKDGKQVTTSAKFTPEEKDGCVDVSFTFDATGLESKEIVVFEDLYLDGSKLATHADIEDEGQTVIVPGLGTTAMGVEDTNMIPAAPDQTIVDTVCYTNVTPGLEYEVQGILMDKETGEPLLTQDGEQVVTSATFTPEEKDGCVEVPFTFDATGLQGKQTVVFEDLYLDKTKLATHADIDDEGQTIVFPEIGTEASGLEGTNMIPADGEQTIVDQVCYTNVVPGKEYEVQGILMDKETNKPLLTQDGEEIVTSGTFTPEEANGCMEMEFTFDATGLQGKEIVVFEDLYLDKTKLATHADIEDEAQTVTVPKLKTTATGKEGEKVVEANSTVEIVDNVCYENLEVGKEFVFKGKLMDKSTGKEFLVNGQPILGEATHTPSKSTDCVDVTFTFNASGLKSSTDLVVFESVEHEGVEFATHADLDDKDQTVTLKPGNPPNKGAITGEGLTGTNPWLIGLGGLLVAAAVAGTIMARKEHS